MATDLETWFNYWENLKDFQTLMFYDSMAFIEKNHNFQKFLTEE